MAWLFDLDGVLVDSAAAYRAAWKRWAENRGIDESVVWSDAHGKRPEDIIRRVANEADIRDSLRVFDQALADAAAECRAMPGATECLACLEGVDWAIVTSGRRGHVLACLQQCDLRLPGVLICGDEISRGKPDPECFLRAARGLHAEPGSCTVVEDAPIGIEAAHAAGMPVIAVTTTHDRRELGEADDLFVASRPYPTHPWPPA